MEIDYHPVPISEFENNRLEKPVNLTLTPFLFEEKDEYNQSDWLMLLMWCFDRESKMNCCKIVNFPTYCCIELNENCYYQEIPDGGTIHEARYILKEDTVYWDEDLVADLYEVICQKLKKQGKSLPLTYSFGMYSDIYYYTKRKKPYMYLYFKSLKAKKEFKTACTRYNFYFNRSYEYITLTVHEEKVSAFMRMMAKRKLRWNGWFNVNAVEVLNGSEYRITNKNIKEYYINWESIIPIDPSVSSSWRICPRLLAYDFEVYGHKGVKRFVNSSATKDAIFMISIDFKLLEVKESRMKFCLVYGESKPIEGAQVFNFKSEPDLLVAFSRLVTYLDPDFVFGYNINKFDEPYLLGRYDIHRIPQEHIPSFSRLLNEPTEVYDQKWKSSGRGENIITFVKKSGRATVDELPLIKSLYKLRMYTLEFVSNKYLKAGKRKITVAQMFDAFESYHDAKKSGNEEALQIGIDKMTEVADYCIQDSTLTIDLFENRLLWYHLRSLSGEGGVSIPQIYLNGEQCRCYSQLYIQCTNNNYVLSNSRYFDYYYSGGFVGKPIPGVYSYVFTLDFSSLYPSIIQAYNLCWRTFIPIWMWSQIPEENCEIIKVVQEEPTEHFSLSRKTDIEDKIKVKRTGYHVEITDEEYEYIKRGIHEVNTVLDPDNPIEDIPESNPQDLEEVPEKTVRHYEFRFIKRKFMEGFLPKLEREWVSARKQVKNRIKDLGKKLTYLEFLKKGSLKSKDYDSELEKEIADIENTSAPLVEELETIEEKKIELDSEFELLKSEYQNEDELNEEIKKIKDELEYCELEIKIQDLNKKLETYLEQYEKLQTLQKIRTSDDVTKEIQLLNQQIEAIISEITTCDKTQNAIKIVANSGYGFTGVREGMLSGVFIAICVTYLGRQLIQKANDVLSKAFAHMGAVVVYNDTDSSMIALDIKSEDVLSGKVDLAAIGKEMEEIISGRKEVRDKSGKIIKEAIEPVFKDPLKMEFEDCCQMCPIKPKYYLKAIRNTKLEKILEEGEFVIEDGEILIKKKGVLTAKRGNSTYSMKVYQDLSDRVLFMKDIISSLKSLSGHVESLLMDDYEASELTKVTELGSDYKEESYYMNVFSQNLAKWGKPVRPGDRIEYIIVKTREEIDTGKDQNIGHKCREIGMWYDDDKREGIDYSYYVSKGIECQYDDLFKVGYSKIIKDERLKFLGYQPMFGKEGKVSRKHFVHFGTPIKMISAMLDDIMNVGDEYFNAYLEENFECNYDPETPRNYYAARLISYELDRICEYIKTSGIITAA